MMDTFTETYQTEIKTYDRRKNPVCLDVSRRPNYINQGFIDTLHDYYNYPAILNPSSLEFGSNPKPKEGLQIPRSYEKMRPSTGYVPYAPLDKKIKQKSHCVDKEAKQPPVSVRKSLPLDFSEPKRHSVVKLRNRNSSGSSRGTHPESGRLSTHSMGQYSRSSSGSPVKEARSVGVALRKKSQRALKFFGNLFASKNSSDSSSALSSPETPARNKQSTSKSAIRSPKVQPLSSINSRLSDSVKTQSEPSSPIFLPCGLPEESRSKKDPSLEPTPKRHIRDRGVPLIKSSTNRPRRSGDLVLKLDKNIEKLKEDLVRPVSGCFSIYDSPNAQAQNNSHSIVSSSHMGSKSRVSHGATPPKELESDNDSVFESGNSAFTSPHKVSLPSQKAPTLPSQESYLSSGGRSNVRPSPPPYSAVVRRAYPQQQGTIFRFPSLPPEPCDRPNYVRLPSAPPPSPAAWPPSRLSLPATDYAHINSTFTMAAQKLASQRSQNLEDLSHSIQELNIIGGRSSHRPAQDHAINLRKVSHPLTRGNSGGH